MRFQELAFEHFGVLTAAGARTFALGPINVVLGPNEAGKSTFASGLETLLFGFEPANRDNHPLYQWDGGSSNLELCAVIVDEQGGRTALERTLQSSQRLRTQDADAKTTLADITFSGAHQAGGLIHTQHTKRKLYSALWNLELGDFHAFDEGVQKDIDNLILPPVDGVRLLPTRSVIAALEGEARTLYRKDRRGKTRVEEHAKRRRELRAEIAQATERVEALRAAQDRLPAIDTRLQAIQAETARLRQTQRDDQAQAEIAALLARENEMGALRSFVEAPLEDPRPLLKQLDELEAAVVEPTARCARPALVLDAADQRVLDHAAELRGLSESSALLAQRLGAWREREQDLAVDRAALQHEVATLLGGDPKDKTSHAMGWLQSVSTAALEAGVKQWRTEREQPTAANLSWWRLIVGVVAFVVSALLVRPYSWAAGGVGLVLVAWHVWLDVRWRTQRNVQAPMPADLKARFAALSGLAAEYTATPEGLERLVVRLDPLAKRVLQVESAATRTAQEWQALASEAARGGALAKQVGLTEWDATATDPQVLAEQVLALRAAVSGALERATHAQAAAADDAREREAAQQALRQAQAQSTRLQERVAPIRATLNHAFANQPDLGAAYGLWAEERERLIGLQQERRGLEQRFPDFAELEGRVLDGRLTAGALGTQENPASAAAFDAQTQELADERDALLQERGRLQEMLKGAPDENGVAELMDADREAADAMQAARREHDRLRLLQVLLGEADRLWRAEHEPDVLKKAGEYLRAFTGGRYERLMSNDEHAERTLEVLDASGEVRTVGAPLSRGTRDQIHLALRLALIDHLDQSGERLPLVLDEVLVHWDAARRAAIYAALQTVAQHRQVFLMTCHQAFADEACAALGVTAIQLGA